MKLICVVSVILWWCYKIIKIHVFSFSHFLLNVLPLQMDAIMILYLRNIWNCKLNSKVRHAWIRVASSTMISANKITT